MKRGVLLINLGTPDHCDVKSVRRYLKEFLSDPHVIDIPKFFRSVLVNFFIVPFRSKKATHAYQKIWLDAGSPLRVYSEQLQKELSEYLGEQDCVALGMRYGNPSIASALEKLKECDQLTIIPLFPQYASASTGSALQACSKQCTTPAVKIKRDFHNDPGFIAAYADVIKKNSAEKTPEVFLFSYHGLPEHHLHKGECQTNCNCYRAQCFTTSKLLANALHLEPHQYRVCFQSRLGRIPWITPYTDKLLSELIEQGIKNIAIVSPSFVVDCLETLEEIDIRAREQWRSLGGEEFKFIPCLNTHPLWVQTLASWV